MNIPIKVAKSIADDFDWRLVVIFAIDGEKQHITTYGRSESDSAMVAEIGNKLKRNLGWSEDLCKAKPLERICSNCSFFKSDYGFHSWGMGWSRDGSCGDCFLEPETVSRCKNDRACRYFEGVNWG